MRFFIFATECFVWFMTESEVTCMTALSFRVSSPKNHFLSQWLRIKASYDKSWRTVQYRKHYQTDQWSKSCFDALHTLQGCFTSDVFVLLHTWGQGTTQILLGKIIRPIQNLNLVYPIELNYWDLT